MADRKLTFVSNETVEDKIRRYTRPHDLVTNHIRNNPGLLCGKAPTYPLISCSTLEASSRKPSPRKPQQPQQQQQQKPVRNTPFRNHNPPPRTRKRFRSVNRPHLSDISHNKRCNSTSSSTTSSVEDLYISGHEDELHDDNSCINYGIYRGVTNKYHNLSEEIDCYTHHHCQSRDLLDKKLKLRSALLILLRKQYPGMSLHLVGSSCNGFGLDSSDADFCVMLNSLGTIDQMYEARFHLQAVESLLYSMHSLQNIQFIHAKVPILKFEDTLSGCECDININNTVGIRNTHLLRTYSKIDDRVRPLVVSIKRWAKARGINDASQGTLSSYSLVLMVIHYLQCGCSPPVLYSLQKRFPDFFKQSLNVDDLPLFDPAAFIPCNDADNLQSVGQLFVGFFRYFDETFIWDMEIMSVRLGRSIMKKEHVEFRHKYICVEEPFNLTNTARAVHDVIQFVLIKKEFARANRLLKESLVMERIL